MQGSNIDESKLIVSWNRYEQSLMKKHLMECAYSDNLWCFGNQDDVVELYGYLVKHCVLPKAHYNAPSIQRLVMDIKRAIGNTLQTYKGDRSFDGASDYSINDDNETKFLTRFAMAVQDTKIRGSFYPESINYIDNNGYVHYTPHDQPNIIQATPKLKIAKAKLFSLATQLTRIGLNCQTTVSNSTNLRNPTNGNSPRTINFIDTNNFLYDGSLNMQNLSIGMEPVEYYFNLYRKLFDLALKREWDQMQKGEPPKIPRFLIPLTGYWDKSHKTVNPAIKQALEKLFTIKYNASQTYGDLIAVDIVDYNNNNSGLFKDWEERGHGRVISYASKTDLFNDNRYEEYAIGSGDHYTFIGNECMDCWQFPDHNISHEAFAMKTDFPKFYGQNTGFAQNNGYYIIDPKNFKMPTDYQLHMNYQNDMIVPMNEINRGIKFDTRYAIENFYKQKQYY